MKIKIVLAAVIMALVSCQEKEANFHLSGKVKGLREGKLLLQRVDDTTVIDLDSTDIYGDPSYRLSTTIDEPQILYLYLDRTGGEKNDNVVRFFAEEGDMTLNTTLSNFTVDAEISGSENQELMRKYDSVMSRFNDHNLELLKANFEAEKRKDTAGVKETEEQYRNLLKRKYLFTVNYAAQNTSKAIAPYLAITEIPDANVKYLDTIYKMMDRKIQRSMYGEKLNDLIEKRKEERETLPEKSKARKVKNPVSSGKNVLGK